MGSLRCRQSSGPLEGGSACECDRLRGWTSAGRHGAPAVASPGNQQSRARERLNERSELRYARHAASVSRYGQLTDFDGRGRAVCAFPAASVATISKR